MAGYLFIFDIKNRENFKQMQLSKGGISYLELSRAQDQLVIIDKEFKADSYPGYIFIFNFAELINATPQNRMFSIEPKNKFAQKDPKFTQTSWSPDDQFFYAVNTKGFIQKISFSGANILCKKIHEKQITQMRFTWNYEFILTTSIDGACKIINPEDLEEIRKIQSERPLNSGVFSPLMYEQGSNSRFHLIFGGGQDAKDVTTTKGTEGYFQVSIVDFIHEQELAIVKGHIGPVHSLDFHPEGKEFASGSEDGTFRIHILDEEYFVNTQEVGQ